MSGNKNNTIKFPNKEQAIQFLETISNSKGALVVRKDPEIERALKEFKKK